MSQTTIISIVATRSNSGKTTLIENLVKVFKEKNYKVGVLKHDAHKFEIDKKGKDSYRFSAAGADNVMLASSNKVALMQNLHEEKELDQLLGMFDNMDIVFIEGFRSNDYPKIEVHRSVRDHNFLYNDPNYNNESFVAIASDEAIDTNIPVMDLNNVQKIAQFIEDRFMKGTAA